MDFSKFKFRGESSNPLYNQLLEALEGAIEIKSQPNDGDERVS
jgi:hypothetical protein